MLLGINPIAVNNNNNNNNNNNYYYYYFVKLYMFRAYLGPSSGGTTVCIQQLVLIILFRWLSVCSNPTSTTDSHLKRTLSTNCCIHTVVPPDDGPRYGRNLQRLTKYTENKLCIKLVSLDTIRWLFSYFFLFLHRALWYNLCNTNKRNGQFSKININ
jgi:hypothetical protein